MSSDMKAAPALLERARRMRYLLGDKGYDADRLRALARDAGATPVIRGRRNRKRVYPWLAVALGGRRAAGAPSARPSASTGRASPASSGSLNQIEPLTSMGPCPRFNQFLLPGQTFSRKRTFVDFDCMANSVRYDALKEQTA
jgi:hypothetical protein